MVFGNATFEKGVDFDLMRVIKTSQCSLQHEISVIKRGTKELASSFSIICHGRTQRKDDPLPAREQAFPRI
jgi:hypothetical protein